MSRPAFSPVLLGLFALFISLECASAQTGSSAYNLAIEAGKTTCTRLTLIPGAHYEIIVVGEDAEFFTSIVTNATCSPEAAALVVDDNTGGFDPDYTALRFNAGNGIYWLRNRVVSGLVQGQLQMSWEPRVEGAFSLPPGIPTLTVIEGTASTGAASQSREYKPGATMRDCDKCPEMVVVPAGNFMMGSPPSEAGRTADEGPVHPVAIAKPFAIGKYELTFEEYDQCVQEKGCFTTPGDAGWGRGRRPVMSVAYEDAQRYVAWLSQKTGAKYFIPSEAEWEYAARSGTTTPWNTGDAVITDDANILNQFQKTVPVGAYPPNAFGIYDMIGNVYEWTQDCLDTGYIGTPRDGAASVAGDCTSKRVMRGGSFTNEPGQLRSAYRHPVPANTVATNAGFRIARALD